MSIPGPIHLLACHESKAFCNMETVRHMVDIILPAEYKLVILSHVKWKEQN